MLTPTRPPRIEVRPIETISRQPDYYLAWPTVIRRRNGELALVYSGGRDAHVCPFGRLELMTSADEGATWSEPRRILDSPIDVRDGGIVETQRGTLIASTFTSLYYQKVMAQESRFRLIHKDRADHRLARWKAQEVMTTAEEKQQALGLWITRSTDGGQTWSEKLRTPCISPHGPTELSDGRLLYVGRSLWAEDERGAWISSDEGLTWSALGTFPVPEGQTKEMYREFHAVEAADGTVIALIRSWLGENPDGTSHWATLQSESDDHGRTWTLPRETGITGYPPHLLRLRDGRLLVTYGWRKDPYGIRGRISGDHGRTWTEEFILTDTAKNFDLGYPSTAELADGTLLTVWYESTRGASRLVSAPDGTTAFTYEEIAGSSGQTALRQAKWSLDRQP